MTLSQEDLFDVVRTWTAFGDHRTGTDTLAAATTWLSSTIADAGGVVEESQFDFDRYVAEWEVTIDGDDVDALPLFYEATGQASSDDPVRVVDLAPAIGGPLGTSDSPGSGGAPGSITIASTRHDLGLLTVPNRAVMTPTGDNGHVLLVADRYRDALDAGAPIKATINARIEPSSCRNLIARFGGAADTSPVVITTPISGWFGCAGERATGIAAAISLASAIGEMTPVVLLGASGHELNAIGAGPLQERFITRAQLVVHVGANIGCDWQAGEDLAAPTPELTPVRWSGPDGMAPALTAALAPSQHQAVFTDPVTGRWFGEAAHWLDAPMLLSLVSANPWFHCPEDQPDTSCSAERTAAVAGALIAAVEALLPTLES